MPSASHAPYTSVTESCDDQQPDPFIRQQIDFMAHRSSELRRKSSSLAAAAYHDRSTLTHEEDDGIDGDPTAWAAFSDVFGQVQSVLDRNRKLIHQVNENHHSKIHGNIVKNVALIQEINGNMSKVVSLYSDLSGNFSGLFPRSQN